MNKTQIARNCLLALALANFGAATFGIDKVLSIHMLPAGLFFWCASVVIKVSNAKSGVFF